MAARGASAGRRGTNNHPGRDSPIGPGENVVVNTPAQNVVMLCWAASTFLGNGDLSVPRRKGERQALKVL